MSGNDLRDAWDTLDTDPEDAARRVVQAQVDQKTVDDLTVALQILVRSNVQVLASGQDDGALDPVREAQAHHGGMLEQDVPAFDPCSLDDARTMVRTHPHSAVGWIADAGILPAQDAVLARAVLSLLAVKAPTLDFTGLAGTGDEAALLALLDRVRPSLASAARSTLVEALDQAPTVRAWALMGNRTV